jgi:hypothetical protein
MIKTIKIIIFALASVLVLASGCRLGKWIAKQSALFSHHPKGGWRCRRPMKPPADPCAGRFHIRIYAQNLPGSPRLMTVGRMECCTPA